jgi:hypothetical protein
MTRQAIITTLALFPFKPFVIAFSISGLLLLSAIIPFFSFSKNIPISDYSFSTDSHQAWAFAPTPASNDSNTSSADQGNNITTSSTNQPTNQAPVADNKSDVTATQDTPVRITLSGSDGNNDPIQFAIASFPSNGSLSGFDVSSNATNTIITYTPNQGFVGKDSFTYTVTDSKGVVSNKTAIVSVTVMPKPNSAPTVPASQSIETDEGKSIPITLTATDADNDDNGTLTFFLLSLPSNGTLTGTAPDLVYTPQQNYSGTDSFTYKVNDGEADSNVGTVTINVRAVNEPPTADAGPDQTVNEGDIVRLDGSAGTDADGTIASYSWTQTSGTSVTLTDTNSATPTFIAPGVEADGETITFELMVTDNNGATATDTVNIKVNHAVVNQPPTANAGADQTVNSGDTVTLNGAASTDTDGRISSYSWRQTAGPPVANLIGATTSSPTFVVPYVSSDTKLEFALVVTDDAGVRSPADYVSITLRFASTQSSPTPVQYSFLKAWGSEGSDEGQFNGSKGIATDSQGNVYVAEDWNNRIQKFDSNGEFITEWGSRSEDEGQFDRPFDIAIGLQGYAYVVDGLNRVQVWAPGGTT